MDKLAAGTLDIISWVAAAVVMDKLATGTLEIICWIGGAVANVRVAAGGNLLTAI